MPRREGQVQVNILLSREELERVERLRERLQARMNLPVRVTNRTVLLKALEQLEAQLDRQEKDKARER